VKSVTKVALIALLWSLAISAGTLGVIDTELRLQMAHAWWTKTEEVQIQPGAKPRIRGDIRFGVVGVGGKRYIAYDLGQSMLMLPGDWLGTQLHRWLPALDEEYLRELTVSLLIFVPLNVAAVIACFWLLRLLGFEEGLAGLSSITWFLGTTALHYAQLHQQNNQILLFSILGYGAALAYVLRQRPYWAFLSGLVAGAAILMRFTSLIHSLTMALFLIGCAAYQTRSFRQVLRGIGWWLLGLLPPVLLARILDFLRYGGFWDTGKSMEDLQLMTDPMWDKMPQLPPGYPFLDNPAMGILGTLFSPAKSIFIYDPFLLPCLVLALVLWRRLSPYMQWYLITVTFNLILHLVAYSRYLFWHGDSAWGARYHVTSVQLLLIPLIAALLQQIFLAKGFKKRLMQLLIVLAISVQLASVAMPMDLEIFQAEAGMPGSRFNFRLGQRLLNLSCLIQPTWSSRCTESNPDKKSIVSPWNHLAFIPFTFEKKIKGDPHLLKYSKFILVIWFVILMLAIVTTWRYCF
jgi:hypothetical protein